MKLIVQKMRTLKLSKIDDNYLVHYYGYILRLMKSDAMSLVNDSGLWEDTCLPIDIRNKTVLDVGCGCGETMAFYFAHGAKKVIGIEADSEASLFARVNVWENRWNADLISEPFALHHLSIPHDFLMIHLEGAEQNLLCYDGKLGPCAIKFESSGLFDLAKLLLKHFPDLSLRYQGKSGTIILNGYDDSRIPNECYDREVGYQRRRSNGEMDLPDGLNGIV